MGWSRWPAWRQSGGALLAPVLRDRVPEKRLIARAALVIGVCALAVTQWYDLHRRPAALVLAITVGLGASVAKTAFDAIVQRDTPDHDRAYLFARFEAIFQLGWVLGALAPTLLTISLLAGLMASRSPCWRPRASLWSGLVRLREPVEEWPQLPRAPHGVNPHACRRSATARRGGQPSGRSGRSGRSIRANHSPGASSSAGVGSSRSERHSRSSPSEPARSTMPRMKACPRS